MRTLDRLSKFRQKIIYQVRLLSHWGKTPSHFDGTLLIDVPACVETKSRNNAVIDFWETVSAYTSFLSNKIDNP